VVSNTSGAIVTASGTSFSCPIMAGAIASLWQAIPWATNQEVVTFVKESADRFTNPTNQFGYGIPDFQNALDRALLSTNQNQFDKFLVYPNPVKNYFSISFPNGFYSANLSIYNSLGQIIFNKEVNSSSSIYVDDLSLGIYYYKIESNSFVQKGKLIKN
jgi:subtilisin family serine protease